MSDDFVVDFVVPDDELDAVPDDELDAVPVVDDACDVEPLEPVVSAKATAGVDAIAAPTPSAAASAPIRPICAA